MDEERFLRSWRQALEEASGAAGIGTLSEKRLHAALKYYYAPDASCREVKIGRYVADVFDGERIVEIQSRNFRYLCPKLQEFLERYPVHVVHPIPRSRYLVWTDPATGCSTKPHKCRSVGRPLEAFEELYAIRQFLPSDRLSVELLLFDLDEYRLLDGRGENRKKGATKLEKIPRGVPTSVFLQTKADYAALLPETLPERFTVSQFSRLTGVRGRASYSAVHVLETLGIFEQDGTEGRAAAYRLSGCNSGAKCAYSSDTSLHTSPEKRS